MKTEFPKENATKKWPSPAPAQAGARRRLKAPAEGPGWPPFTGRGTKFQREKWESNLYM